MQENVQARIVAIRNELAAQKQASKLAYGQLTSTNLTPTAHWQGDVDTNTPLEPWGRVAEFRARFTRTDGVSSPPIVDFAYSASASPTAIEILRQQGHTITADDIEALYEGGMSGWVSNIGENYVDFAVSLESSSLVARNTGTVGVSIDVVAISPIRGELTIERVYE